jgi:ElaB/YqjD/DUF883 family membrane-anchored ribosome-binding protein
MATSTTTGSTGTQKHLDRMSEGAHSAVDRATETAEQIAQRFGEKSDELLAMKDDYLESTREYVRENPFAALGIALAAGYLFAKITSWR